MGKKKRTKFSPQFERDYTFYFFNKANFTFSGSNIKNDYLIQFPDEPEQIEKDENGNLISVPFSIPYLKTGASAKTCFHQLDSTGKCNPCAEPHLLVEILNCKAAINLQIKMWAQGWAEYTISKAELIEYLNYYQAPNWVFAAIENQKKKILKNWADQKKYQSDYYQRIFELHWGEALEEIGLDGQ